MASVVNATQAQLPNPYTPMAFLPPDAANLVVYGTLGTIWSVAVIIWDIILHLPQDYELLTQYRINISMVVYCIARLSILVYLLGLAVFQTSPIHNCKTFRRIAMVFPFTVPSMTLLVVFRACALYNNNPYVVTFFSLSWLVLVVSCVTVPFASTAVHIGISGYCTTQVKSLVMFGIIYVPIHETMIFLATSWAFLQSSYTDTNVANGFRVMVLGKFLPAFSKSILHDGQAYYLATLLIYLTYFVAFYNHNIPRAVSTVLAVPAFACLSNMSCHIYRNVRLGYYRDYSIRTSVINKALRVPTTSPTQPGRSTNSSGSRPTETSIGVYIQTSRTVDQDDGNQVEGDQYEMQSIRTGSSNP